MQHWHLTDVAVRIFGCSVKSASFALFHWRETLLFQCVGFHLNWTQLMPLVEPQLHNASIPTFFHQRPWEFWAMPQHRTMTLAPPSSHSSALRRKPKRARVLEPNMARVEPDKRQKRDHFLSSPSTQQLLAPPTFASPTLDRLAAAVKPVISKKAKMSSGSSGSSSSSQSSCPKKKRRGKILARRSKHRLRKYVDEAMQASAQGLSLLEKKAIGDRSQKYYQQEYQHLLAFAKSMKKPLTAASQVDQTVTEYFNHLFFQGHPGQNFWDAEWPIWSSHPLVTSVEPRGVPAAIQDRRVRRQPVIRLSLHEALGPALDAAADQQKQAPAAVELWLWPLLPDLCPCDKAFALGHQSLLAPAQRSKHRPKSRTAVLAGSAKEGQVEKLQECGSLREVSQIGLQLPAAQPEAPTTLPSRRNTARGSDVWQGPSSAPSLKKKGAKGQYVADFFAGSGGLAHQCRRLGYRAKEWEISRGPQFDLTKPQVLRCIRHDISQRLVLAAMLAPPDSSFSAARDRHSVLRTQQYPWGLPNHLLSSADQLRVENRNKCFAAALKIISWLDQQHIPWILENPSSSKCWCLPDLQQLMRAPHCVTVLTDSCQFGTKWRKRGRLLRGHLDSQDVARLERLCAGRGLCSQTGSKHFQLTGSNRQGIPWTRIAEPYAKGLCQQLAFVLTCATHYSFNPLWTFLSWDLCFGIGGFNAVFLTFIICSIVCSAFIVCLCDLTCSAFSVWLCDLTTCSALIVWPCDPTASMSDDFELTGRNDDLSQTLSISFSFHCVVVCHPSGCQDWAVRALRKSWSECLVKSGSENTGRLKAAGAVDLGHNAQVTQTLLYTISPWPLVASMQYS